MNADRLTGHRDAWRQPKGAGADLQVPMDRLPDGDVSGEGERAQERFRPGIGCAAMRHWLNNPFTPDSPGAHRSVRSISQAAKHSGCR